MRRIQRSPRFGCLTTPSRDVRAVRLNFGWAEGNITVDVADRYFAATAASSSLRSPKKASWSQSDFVVPAFRVSVKDVKTNMC